MFLLYCKLKYFLYKRQYNKTHKKPYRYIPDCNDSLISFAEYESVLKAQLEVKIAMLKYILSGEIDTSHQKGSNE